MTSEAGMEQPLRYFAEKQQKNKAEIAREKLKGRGSAQEISRLALAAYEKTLKDKSLKLESAATAPALAQQRKRKRPASAQENVSDSPNGHSGLRAPTANRPLTERKSLEDFQLFLRKKLAKEQAADPSQRQQQAQQDALRQMMFAHLHRAINTSPPSVSRSLPQEFLSSPMLPCLDILPGSAAAAEASQMNLGVISDGTQQQFPHVHGMSNFVKVPSPMPHSRLSPFMPSGELLRQLESAAQQQTRINLEQMHTPGLNDMPAGMTASKCAVTPPATSSAAATAAAAARQRTMHDRQQALQNVQQVQPTQRRSILKKLKGFHTEGS